MFKLLYLVCIALASCTTMQDGSDDKTLKDIVNSSTLEIPIKENYQRILSNGFYDMSGKLKSVNKSKLLIIGNTTSSKIISGADTTGIAVQYIKIVGINYKLKLTSDYTKKEYVIHSGYVKSYAQYSGSISDLFAEYTAELNAEDNAAMQASRELYYNILMVVKSHLKKCSRVKKALDRYKEFVFANDKGEIENKEIEILRLEDINESKIKKIDYEIYKHACTII